MRIGKSTTPPVLTPILDLPSSILKSPFSILNSSVQNLAMVSRSRYKRSTHDRLAIAPRLARERAA